MAKNIYQSTLQKEAPDSEVMVIVQHQQGDILRLLGHFDEAEQSLKDALAIAQHRNSSEVPAILFSLGKTASVATVDIDHQTVLDFYNRALTHLVPPIFTPPGHENPDISTDASLVTDPLLVVQIQ